MSDPTYYPSCRGHVSLNEEGTCEFCGGETIPSRTLEVTEPRILALTTNEEG